MNHLNPQAIPLHKKKSLLASYSEDDFRDKVVRPIYLLKGLTHGKDVCGVDEDGKDCYLWGSDTVRGRVLYVFQTKKGNVKMSSKAATNLLNIVAQLRTALNTEVHDATTKTRQQPDYAVLAVSGEINKKAEEYITSEIKDSRIVFRDCDDLIQYVDELMPALWFDIDTKKIPYLQDLKKSLVDASDTVDMRHIGIGSEVSAPITNESFVQLFLHRTKTKLSKQHGQLKDELDFQEIPVQQVLNERDRLILITGDAGAGKTTTLRRLATILIDKSLQESKRSPTPVFINARDVAASTGDFVSILAQETQRISPSSGTGFTLDDLNEGNVTVLIDGFDELATEDRREMLLGHINSFHQSHPGCQIIMASRDYLFVRDAINKSGFARFNVSPINLRQAEKMIGRLSHGKELPSHQIQEVLRRLNNVHGIELNPLLITVFVATTDYSRTDIPANITELFKKFTEMMLGRWDQSKGLSQQYQSQVKDFLLCKIGYYVHSRKQTHVPLELVKNIIHDSLAERDLKADIDTLFDEIVNRSGLVRVESNELSFRHLLIQEFFAGRGISDPANLHTLATDYWWSRPIIFYFGENPDSEAALSRLCTDLSTVNGTELFQASVTVGLALQAAYLTPSSPKLKLLSWVASSMSIVFPDVLKRFSNDGLPDLLQVIMYYSYGRDAVGTKIIRLLTQEHFSPSDAIESEEHQDRWVFWLIVGLIEARELTQAAQMIAKFNPRDSRLLLAIHLAAYQLEHLQVTSPVDKQAAKKIRSKIEPKIEHLKGKVVTQIKEFLASFRKGELKALGPPATSSQPG